SPAAIDPAPGLKKEVKVQLEISYPIFYCFVLQRDRPSADLLWCIGVLL
ncbi:Os06g0483701, partial [Oryza sativa Japonica Group]